MLTATNFSAFIQKFKSYYQRNQSAVSISHFIFFIRVKSIFSLLSFFCRMHRHIGFYTSYKSRCCTYSSPNIKEKKNIKTKPNQHPYMLYRKKKRKTAPNKRILILLSLKYKTSAPYFLFKYLFIYLRNIEKYLPLKNCLYLRQNLRHRQIYSISMNFKLIRINNNKKNEKRVSIFTRKKTTKEKCTFYSYL